MAIAKRKMALGGVAALIAVAMSPPVQAQDFLSNLFSAFGVRRPQPTMTPMPYGGEENRAFLLKARSRAPAPMAAAAKPFASAPATGLFPDFERR